MNEVRARNIGRINRKLLPATPVTFRADGTIDRAAQDSYAAWLTSQPIGGVAIWAHTGRGLLLNRDQRAEVARCWVDACGDGQLVIAGVGAVPDQTAPEAARRQKYRDESLAMAEHALELGADMLMMYAPTVYRGAPDQDEQVIAQAKHLAALGEPLLLFYLYEAAGGVTYSLEVLQELFSIPEVVGIKMATLDSPMTYQDVAILLKDEYAELVLVSGEDRFLGYSFMCGATAALVGMGCACTAPQAALMQRWFDGHMAEFVQLNQFVDGFAQATFCAPMEGYIQRMLWSLVDDGIVPAEASFDPWGPALPAAEREVVRRRAAALKSAV